MRLLCALCLLIIYLVSNVLSVNNLREEFTWTRIDYDWGNNNRRTRQVDLENRYGYSGRTTRRPHTNVRDKEQLLYFPESNSGRPRPNNNYGGRPNNSVNRPNGRPSQNQANSWQNSEIGEFNQGNGQGNSQTQGDQQGNSWTGQQNQGNNQQSSGNAGNIGRPSSTQGRENYIYQNNIPMGAGVWRDKLFITVPRRRHGVPSSLNYVSLSSQNRRNTPLIPYPNWEMNALPDSYNTTDFSNATLSPAERNRFVSVYRVAVDNCDRLWFVDTGRLEIPNAPIQVQAPKLVVMDLRTNTVLRQYTFPDSDLRPASLFAHVVVETEPNNCNVAHAYIPDVGGYGLVVYSWRNNRSWRVTHNYFYLEPLRGEFQVAGHTFQWNDGVFSTALSPITNGRRDLYFHSMAGSHLYRVSTEILKNRTQATRSYHGQDFQNLGDRGEGSQTSASALDEQTGVLLLGLVNQNALACWNINRPLSDISIVQRDDQRMIYPCDLKVYNNNIYLLTNTMPGFLYGQLNYDEVNFRIWVQNVGEAIEGTSCASGSSRAGNRGGSSGGSNRRDYGVVANNRDRFGSEFF